MNHHILPIPKVKQTDKINSRKRGKTESPYKNDLQITLKKSQDKKEEKKIKKKSTILRKPFKSVPSKKKKSSRSR